MKNRFELTDQHIALLQRMNITWNDDGYEGVPTVDIKRPYGNSNIWDDVAKITGMPKGEEDDDGEYHWPKGTKAKCIKLHKETRLALQICLSAKTFEPGVYESDYYRDNWRKL